MRLVTWRRAVGAGAIGLVALTGGTWALAGQARTPRQLAADAAAPPKSTITVPVRFERLVRTADLTCKAGASSLAPVRVTPPEGGDAIVTALPTKEGAPVQEGAVVLEVSGRPVIVLKGRLPAYRDIQPGATGPDVEQLQTALIRLGLLTQGGSSGVFDDRTRMAVARFYRERGYSAPTVGGNGPEAGPTPEPDESPSRRDRGQGRADNPHATGMVPRSELIIVSRLPARLGSVRARVGGPAKSGDVVIETGRPVLRCQAADPGAVQGLRRGAKATATGPRGERPAGRVTALSSKGTADGRTSKADEPEGTVVAIRTDDHLAVGETYQARVEVEKSDDFGPVVPSSALWSQSGGRTVVRVVRGGERLDVEVEPGFEVDGQVTVRAVKGEFQRGDEVIVTAQPDPPAGGDGS